MGRNWVVRILQGIQWRLARWTLMIVLRASSNDSDLISPKGLTLIRTKGNITDRELVEDAMRAAGEPEDLAAPRFTHGDEFFGWLVGGEIVSFGWVTYRDRKVGPIRFAENPGRAFLFNFHTLERHRKRGLYTALLLAMRCALGREKVTEFLIDISAHNTASAKGIKKAGFLPVAQVAYLVIFNRWYYLLKRTVLDTASPLPF